jgi:cation diffusion facilitator CzcD-associated flavoprotein CzcO
VSEVAAAEDTRQSIREYDVVVVGAGFSGLYLLQGLRQMGFSVILFEAAKDLGGTWYWNRYPGARVDSSATVYQFSDENLADGFDFDELFPDDNQMRAYFDHVDKVYGLRADIEFENPVLGADWDEERRVWTILSKKGIPTEARYVIFATGSSYKPYRPSIAGLEDFAGRVLHTAAWPEEGIDLAGKRVGVIGTGASGVQVVQELGNEATVASLTVFQRTPNLALPMQQKKFTNDDKALLKGQMPEHMAMRFHSFSGMEFDFMDKATFDVSDEQRLATYERLWRAGGLRFWVATYNDLLFDSKASSVAYEFWREKTRKRINKPELWELLAPTTPPHPFGVKRPSLEQNYFEIFDKDFVRLVDLKATPIDRLVAEGLKTSDGVVHELDVLVMATGFDANTGALKDIDIRGVDGTALADKWANGVDAYLGIASAGFPNALFSYGPQSPAAFCNGPTSAELQGNVLADLLDYMRANGKSRIESTTGADTAWTEQIEQMLSASLLDQADSWYLGANIPGKKRQLLNFPGGVPAYVERLRTLKAEGYKGFEID